MSTNIVRRGSTYYIRVMVPVELSEARAKQEVWKSLGTKNHADARKRAPIVLDRLRQEWDEKRRRRSLTAADAETLIWERYTALIEADDRFRAALPSDAQLTQIWHLLETEFGEYSLEAYRIFETVRDAFKDERAARKERLSVLKADAASGETRSVAEIMSDLLAKEGLQATDGPDHRNLAQRLQRAEMEYLKRAGERDAGDFTGTPSDPVVKQPTALRVPRAKPGETIMELYDQFRVEKAGTASDDTWAQNRRIMELFASFVRSDAHVSIVSRKTVRDWKAALFKWPGKAADITAFKGLSFAEVLKANEKIKKPTISERTINKYLSALGSFATWLRSNGYIDDDVMGGMFLTLDKSIRKIKPYSIDQLKTIFASPLFTSCAGDRKECKPGHVKVRDWRYWLPLVGVYSGARLGEVAQMDVADLRQINSHWCFHVTAESGDDKSVKTEGSKRVVPVHPQLLRMGLIEHRAKMKTAGETKLFPGLEQDARGFWSGVPSKFLNKYLMKIGVKTDKTQNVHSFRHSAADAFRRGGYLDEQFGILLGHTGATTTGRYGNIPQGDLSMRIAMINSIEYEGLGTV